MKNLVKGLLMSATFIFTLSFVAFAQKGDGKLQKSGRSDLNLSETQQTQMKANQEIGKANRQKFEATFTAEQKAIMADKALMPKDRMEKLNASLSAEQKSMRNANLEASKVRREAMNSTLTPEQKEKMEKMQAQRGERGKGKSGGKGNGQSKPVKKN